MSALSMSRVLRSREMYGFVKGRLDATLEAIDWVRRALAASALAFVALLALSLFGVETWQLVAAACAAFACLAAIGLAMARRADLLHSSLEEAWSECERAFDAFNRERYAEDES